MIFAKRKPPAVPVVPKSFSYAWKKRPPLVTMGQGSPTAQKPKEESSRET
jgi:hypothetical protein